ncbi:thioesterase II family protein [Streptomyces physcomitrii]|uniref:Alpha/beta fold hydrolase n=1 Tax=Streptomyces physcomitrii TaxID=2724184 RepID=A0ABX1H2T5_9ACTN|nr:alpha/beta fold hydrolase [Streptomyces physcomitrii]NKI42671.1 alpha/beta fold hydrolase [Streptomyces physcomitrii]
MADSTRTTGTDPVKRFSGGFDGQRTIVVGVPQAGSGVPMFSEWPTAFGEAPFLRYHLPGRDRRRAEPAAASIEDLCADLEASLAALGTRGAESLVLTGHCMGALVADAVAARLRDRMRVTTVLSSMRPAKEGLYGAYAASMSDEEILTLMNAALAGSGRPPVHEAFAALAVRTLREDVDLLSRYFGEGGERDFPRTVVHWSEDAFVPADDLDYWRGFAETTVLEADGAPEHYLVAGNAAIRRIEELCAAGERG